MPSIKNDIIERIDDLLGRSKKAETPTIFSSRAKLTSMRVELMQTITDLSPPDSQYRKLAEEAVQQKEWQSLIADLRGVLMGLRQAYSKGYLSNINELIDADIFTDILDQSEYLNGQGYSRAAIVVAGVSLEAHLRKLALKNAIQLVNQGKYVKAETLNEALSKGGIIDKTLQKSITSWLGLRNDAAHPDPTEINEGLIEPMIMGIRNLIEKYPAYTLRAKRPNLELWKIFIRGIR